MRQIKESKDEQFIRALGKLELMELIGIATILCVKLQLNKDEDLRPFEDILSDMISTFEKLNRSQKREILGLIKKVTK